MENSLRIRQKLKSSTKVAHYILYDNRVYRRGYSMPLLKCVTPSEAKYMLRKIHEGTCGNHAEE